MTDDNDPPGDEPDRPPVGPPDDRDDGRPNEDRFGPDRRADSSGGWLSNLLGALESLEELSYSGRNRSGRSNVDYDLSIRSGLDSLGEDRANRPDPPDPPDRRDDRGSRPRRVRTTGPGTRQRVTTRTREDELLVVADLAGTDPEDVVVGFDGSTLVVGLGDRELERVHLPWEEATADAAIRNDVLTVVVEPEEGSP